MPRFRNVLLGVFAVVPLHGYAEDICRGEPPRSSSPALVGVCKALEAVNNSNRLALEELIADEFSLVSVTGRYFEAAKYEMIQRWTAPPASGTSSTSRLTKLFKNYQAATFGFVAGEILDEAQEGNFSTCTVHAFTDIWELRGSRWVWVQSHESGHRTISCKG